jgi:hypothetical protein
MRMTEKVNPTRYVVSTYVNITMYYYYMLINSLKKKKRARVQQGKYILGGESSKCKVPEALQLVRNSRMEQPLCPRADWEAEDQVDRNQIGRICKLG